MAEFETADDRRAIVVPSLRLEFRWAGDRWSHALDVVSEAGLACIARAIEGDADRDDPARVVSPAYQQLHFQRAEGLAQALLVGQSGLHHFSAVFTLREGRDGVGIEVDVADRCRAAIEALACTYWVDLPPTALVDAGPDRTVWETDSPLVGEGRGGGATERRWLTLEASGTTRLAVAEAGRRGTQVQADAQIDLTSHTQRCVYRWQWGSPPP